MRDGLCDVDTYGTIHHKSLLLETWLLCYYYCYSCHCCSYCNLSMPSRKNMENGEMQILL